MRRIDLGRAALDVIEVGRGQPLLFLHGFPERAAGWSPILLHLSADFHCIAPDQRGYGRSTRFTNDRSYVIDELLADVEALLDAYGLERATLIGHDWGGILASWFAARRPERVERLILVNGPHPAALQEALLSDPIQRTASTYIDRLRSQSAAATLLGNGRQAMWDRFFGAVPMPLATKAVYVEGWSDPAALDAMLAWYRAAPFSIPDGPAVPRPAWLEAESWRISRPALAIWGMQDQALLPSLLLRMEPYFDQLTLQRIDDAGHAIIHQQPARVAELIKGFVGA